MSGSRAGQKRANGVNGLTVAPNHPAHVALPELQPENHRLAARDLRQHHFIRKFDELANNEFEKLFHSSLMIFGIGIVVT
jgi:hypothetical protein